MGVKKWLAGLLVLFMALGGAAGAEMESYSLGPVIYTLPFGWVWAEDITGSREQRWHYAQEIGHVNGGYAYAYLDTLDLGWYGRDVAFYKPLREFYEGLTGGSGRIDDCERLQVAECPALIGPYPVDIDGSTLDASILVALNKNELFALAYLDPDVWPSEGRITLEKIAETIIIRGVNPRFCVKSKSGAKRNFCQLVGRGGEQGSAYPP